MSCCSTTKMTRLLAVVLVASAVMASARPNRIKRTSDQHLAHVETNLGLKNIKGVAVTVPLASGLMDVNRIGRKRRSDRRFLDMLFNQSSEEDTGDPIELNYEDLLYKYRLSNYL